MFRPHFAAVPGASSILRRRRPTGRGAFTLVELLVVIGIIALLISILLPALGRAKKEASRTACLANLHSLGQAFVMYLNANKQAFPNSTAFWRSVNDTSYPRHNEDWIYWEGTESAVPRKLEESALGPYLGANGDKLMKIFQCPADVVTDRNNIAGVDGRYLFSYTMNAYCNISPDPAGGLWTTRKVTAFRRASEMILLTEEFNPNDGRWAPPGDRLNKLHAVSVKSINPVSVANYPFNNANPINPGAQVGDRVSTLFIDGHAAPIHQDYADDPRNYDPTKP